MKRLVSDTSKIDQRYKLHERTDTQKKNHKQETWRMKSLIGNDGWREKKKKKQRKDNTWLASHYNSDKWYTERRGELAERRKTLSSSPACACWDTRSLSLSPSLSMKMQLPTALARSPKSLLLLMLSAKVREKKCSIQRDNKGYNEHRKEGSMCDKVNAFKREYGISGDKRKE